MTPLPLRNLPTRVLVLAAAGLWVCAVLIAVLLLKPNNDLTSRRTTFLPIPHLLFGGPIVQLELARSAQDIREILMVGTIAQNVGDARAGNKFDTFLFIPAYSALLLVLALLVSRGAGAWGRGLFYFAVLAICVTAICDWAENAGIERTLNHVDPLRAPQAHGPEPGDAERISRPSIVKWSLLSVILLLLGLFAIPQRPWGTRVLGMGLLLTGIAFLLQLILYFPGIR